MIELKNCLKTLALLPALGMLSQGLITTVQAASAKIVYDSENQLIQEKYGDKWAAEDQELKIS